MGGRSDGRCYGDYLTMDLISSLRLIKDDLSLRPEVHHPPVDSEPPFHVGLNSIFMGLRGRKIGYTQIKVVSRVVR